MRKRVQKGQQRAEQPDDRSLMGPEPIASGSPRTDGLVNAETSNIQQRANAAFRSLLNCSLVTSKYCNTFGDQDLNALEQELTGRSDRLLNGDMRYVEAMGTVAAGEGFPVAILNRNAPASKNAA